MKYKLYHIPFWLLYTYCWWAIQSGNPVQTASDVLFSAYTVKYLFYVVFQALAVYFNLYFLIPRYLETGKFAEYMGWLFLTLVTAAALIVPGYYISTILSGRSFQALYGTKNPDYFHIFLGGPLPSIVAGSTLAMSIKLGKNWLTTRRREKALEKEKLETELNFLKYQFNPHFLFNTINSIFFLIHKNPDMASASLAQFSDLLRYQLYECNDKQISLNNEVAYFENFIGLEKLRQNKDLEVALDIDRQGLKQLGIAPFILMTFVENAFKHVSRHTDRSNWIRIRLSMDEQELDFSVTNSTSHSTSTELVHYGGIGLRNVQRRLDLIYPEQYDLDIRSNTASFEIRLRVRLSELDLSKPVNNLQRIA